MGLAEKAALPSQEPWRADLGHANGIDLHAQYFVERTGGDLFDAVRVGSRVAFLLSDIAGRRPELDPISAEMQRTFRASSAEVFGAVDVNLMEATEMLIHSINQAMMAVAKGARFAPTMVGCYDAQLGVLAYVNAGGQTALFRDSEGTRALPNASVPLGLFSHLPYDASIQAFEPGAMLLAVTKGVTGSLANKNPFGPQRVIEVLQNSKSESASAVCRAVLEAAHRFEKSRWNWSPFRGTPMQEDMTALAIVRTA
jgi:serine phosphatase RsbU (regulator of sigma subunit)